MGKRKNYTGKYKVKNPDKYKGDHTDVIYRSSWERSVMQNFDLNPNYMEWNSECIVVPYISPLDNKMHRYFPDFYVKYKTKSGDVQEALIEVKPDKETRQPLQPKNNHNKAKKRYIQECMTYAVNVEKWKAAMKYCEINNYKFMILTEKHIRPNRTK